MTVAQDGCKVCRVLEEHNLDGYDDRLLDQWRGETGARKGYRSLADWLNVTLLRRAMDRAGVSTLGGEARSRYNRLQGDDPTTAAEVRELLAGEGIPIARLEEDFVSYGVIRTHLKDCLGAERESSTSAWEEEAIGIATDRAEETAAEAVQSLRSKGKLRWGDDPRVETRVELVCESCNARMSLERVLRRELSCECKKAN